MVAVPLIAIAAAGIFAAVVKVVHHQMEKHDLFKPNHQKNSTSTTNPNTTSTSQELSTLLTANIIINGNIYKFMKDSSQPFAHYDLAIDYCIANAKQLGITVDNIKSCIYPLSNIIHQEFQDLIDQHHRLGTAGKQDLLSPSVIEHLQTPKELILSILPAAIESSPSSPSGEETEEGKEQATAQSLPIETPPPPQQEPKKEQPATPSTNDPNLPSKDAHRLTLEINGVNYVFEYFLGRDINESASELANNFCTLKGKNLLEKYFEANRIIDEKNIAQALYAKCYVPLQGSLVVKIEEENEKLFPKSTVLA